MSTARGSSSMFARAYDKLNTPAGHLVAVAIASAAITTGALLGVQHGRRTHKRNQLRNQLDSRARARQDHATTADMVHDSHDDDDEDELVDFTKLPSPKSTLPTRTTTPQPQPTRTTKRPKKPTNDVIINEALARNHAFFGPDKMNTIRNSFVIVVGLGGVGSATATMLVRSGVKKIRLIDFDQVSLSSLNRHAVATLAQVGTPKVTACADYFAQIAPWVEIDARVALFSAEDADDLLSGNPDYVVDLIAHCHNNGIKVFSSFGAGAKADPSTIQIRPCLPSGNSDRSKLKGISHGVPVVYSTEKPRKDIGLLPLPQEEFEKGKVDELSAIANFRVRILPVLGPLPAMFGNAAATYVLLDLCKFKMEPLPVKNRLKLAKQMHSQLTNLELKRIPISEEDVLYLFEEVHRARAVCPPMHVTSRPCLVRWDKRKPIVWNNLVVFDREQAYEHEKRCLIGDEDPSVVWGQQVANLVQQRFEEEQQIRHWRY
ncbi:hypothetical protein OIV83_003342 [Microbotryomycetes sp. JL201]|nr:hypothetical protein OIV83_003342 [Microbotryomycetes sp. JL201]